MGYFGSSIPTSNITKLQTFNSLYGIPIMLNKQDFQAMKLSIPFMGY